MGAEVHYSTVVFTKSGREIPFGILDDNSLVTDDIRRFVDFMRRGAGRGFVNFADFWSLDEFRQTRASIADLPVLYFLPFDRIVSIELSEVPNLNLVLHRSPNCFWVQDGNTLAAQFAFAQELIRAEQILIEARQMPYEPESKTASRLNANVEASLKRVIIPVYRRLGRYLPTFVRRGLFATWGRMFK